ncbi:NADH-ubiquinone oxidoreductase 12 kda subunit mitochondrial precursor [Dioszegia hungarica]|uniref:NADH-ubiquinone oxidoreductase 12 kDa subunit mitochondrial n=1 Tax=Dioszegia hungarica TaxID=4972 RepID=A0AA38H5K8_9TREE|nr:NADH-ubiquinone oxidoreductase 12 kda subunit mitochondrial precursor [Dioszegia hungarica]KAI9632949.1 NADH-ubiquinone oxidoreductase 12 kda subunit mitochondrial precursor [Dioszegia hungarica]
MSAVPTMDDYRTELKNRENHVRESWVKAMEARLVREELQKCYRGEGVNHLQNCKELAEMYTRMIRENKIKGYTVIETE